MTTDNLPAPRPTRLAAGPRPAPTAALRVIDLQPLHVSDEGWIRHTQFLRLSGNRVTLNGPMREVEQIMTLLRRSGELLKTNDPAPSVPGILVTLTLVNRQPTGRVTPGRPPTVQRWTTRRKVAVFAGAIPATLLAGLVLALLWPLPTVAVAAVLLLLAIRGYRAGLRHQRRSNVPHVAIHHID